MNGAVSKVNKKFISHLTRAKPTPPAATTIQVSHAPPAVRSLVFTAGLRGHFPKWRCSRKRLSVCSVLRCPDLWLQCTKLTLHCNHRSGHLKTEHTESLFLLQRHLGNWPRSKHVKRTVDSAWETWTVAAADGVRCAHVRWEINFLLTFESAQFFCVYFVFRRENTGSDKQAASLIEKTTNFFPIVTHTLSLLIMNVPVIMQGKKYQRIPFVACTQSSSKHF